MNAHGRVNEAATLRCPTQVKEQRAIVSILCSLQLISQLLWVDNTTGKIFIGNRYTEREGRFPMSEADVWSLATIDVDGTPVACIETSAGLYRLEPSLARVGLSGA